MDNVATIIEQISVPTSATIRDTMRAIDRGALGAALLAAEDGTFAGLVTDGDLRRALLAGHGLESPIAGVPRPETRTARVGARREAIAALLSDPVRLVPLLDEAQRVVDLVQFDRRVRLPVAEPFLGEKELLYVSECVLTGWVSSAGKFVTRFEEMMAAFCGTEHAVATSNGTTALHLALLALDVGPGDEVIVPALTFIATANAVMYTGARPVIVDSERESWNMDPEAVARAITPRTRALLPVHLYGHPAHMEPLLAIARRHGLAVIEDAAEAHGACYQGQRVGGIGDLATFSFYGNKIVTTGEGGMVTTNDAELAAKMRMLRDHGMSPERRYWHPVVGYNYRLTNLQAALGVAQMEKVEAILQAKRQLAAAYDAGLGALPGVVLPPRQPWAQPVCWLYSILIDERHFGMSRDQLMQQLQARDIDSRPLFPPLHQQPIYETGQRLPVAESLSTSGISLPSSITMQASEIERVCQAIREIQAAA